jgi:superfamily II DNA/RNA helicase
MTPDTPPALFDALHTLIAPGNRVRVSPYVESAQFRILFGEPPDPAARYEDGLRILRKGQEKIQTLARLWTDFARAGKPFHADAYNSAFLEAYLAYYFTTNVCKVQLVLLELAKRGLLQGHLSVIDVGVGAGTTAVATLDFLVAWATVFSLYGQEFPIQSVDLLCVDSNPGVLAFARQVTLAFASALDERHADRPEGLGLAILSRAAHEIRWEVCELNQELPALGPTPGLLVAANVLGERSLSDAGRENLARAVAALAPGSLAVVIEPGASDSTRKLNGWRRDLVRRYPGVTPLLPCGGELGRDQSDVCGQCWNARREHLHPTTLYQCFREAVAEGSGDRRSWDTFENNLLSWSYTVLLRGSLPRDWPLPGARLIGRKVEGALRFIGSFAGPGASSPVAEDGGGTVWGSAAQEQLKFCPASLQRAAVSEVLLTREAGTLIRKLRHGEVVRVGNNLECEINASEADLRFRDIAKVRWHVERHDPATGFLPGYGPRARAAIDEVGFRLFGFPGMRAFQHDILDRALTGRSVLGIAATGGGKSECYILPAMLFPGVTVVVSPLKSLMQDQYEQRISERYGLQHLTTFINGDVPFRERESRLKRMELGYYKLVYFTPEQLERAYVLDSLKRTHDGVGVRFLALDEAHCISQWGHDFRPSYLNLWHRLKDRGITPVRIGLTATASPAVRHDLLEELQLNEDDLYVHSSNRPELNLIVHVATTGEERTDGIEHALSRLLGSNCTSPHPVAAIVFLPRTGGDPDWTARTVGKPRFGRLSAGVSRFAAYLEKRLRRKVAIYHGKMEDDARREMTASDRDGAEGKDQQAAYERAAASKPMGDLSGRTRRGEQNSFIRGQRDVMVATKGFGMGIDKPNIRLIIHRCAPSNLEAYAQEAGRAGRDGQLADVVLFHSAATDEGVFGDETVPADYEIQQFFLAEKYVRRIDVLAMRAFLLTRRHGAKSTGPVFFTNDEAIAFLESSGKQPGVANLPQPYAWPTFPPRVRRVSEWGEHLSLLDRGHLYEQKTGYVGRILAAMYRIRPVLPGGKRLAFLEAVNDVRPVVENPSLLDAGAIVKSNHYFGGVIRSHGVDSDELTRLLLAAAGGEGLRELAERLQLTLADTAQLVSDIREADGRMSNGRWRPSLLNFRRMTVPKRGPAAGKADVPAWREYAGASRRASDAHDRARLAGREKPNLDDWFGERELPEPKGWEVSLGAALVNEAEFNEALGHFVAEHDSRERNDWASYRLLLTDYIGVSERGERLPRQAQNCLRAVMLGYLETFEVVAGDDCRGCSRCRPKGNFETDLAWRSEQMVVRLGPGISGRLRDLKALEQAVPSSEETERFWTEVEEEDRAGRSVKAYVLGWTAKLLTDTPGHQAALWLRLAGMTRGTFTFQTQEFLDHAERLMADCGDGAASQVLGLLSEVLPATEKHPRLLRAVARLEQRLGRFEQAACTWQQLLECTGALQVAAGLPADESTHEAHASLAQLFAPDGPLAHPDRYHLHARGAARSAADPEKALGHYLALVPSWSFETLGEEVDWIELKAAANLAPRLVRSWLDVDTASRAEKVVRLVSTGRRWESWQERATVALLDALPQNLLAAAPALQFWRVDAWLRGVAPTKDARVAAAAFAALRDGWAPTSTALRRVCQLVFDELPEMEALAALSSSGLDRTALHDAAEGVFRPESASALLRWLTWLPLKRVAATPEKALDALRRGRDLVAKGRVRDLALRARLVNALRLLRDAAVATPRSAEDAHRLWLPICQLHPEEAGRYVADLAKAGAPAAWVDETLELVLQDPNANLRALRVEIPARPGCGSHRLHGVLKLVGLLERLEAVSDIARAALVETEHFAAIRRIFGSERDVEIADMAVELLCLLRQTLNPRWLTPVKDLIQTLVAAKRFDEAYWLSDEALAGPAKSSLDIRGVPVEVYLGERCTGPSRAAPPERADYQRVISSMTRSWGCFRQRGRN